MRYPIWLCGLLLEAVFAFGLPWAGGFVIAVGIAGGGSGALFLWGGTMFAVLGTVVCLGGMWTDWHNGQLRGPDGEWGPDSRRFPGRDCRVCGAKARVDLGLLSCWHHREETVRL